MDVTTLTALLREAEEHHGEYEANSPPHHWSDWYAAYMVSRLQGRTPDEAHQDAIRHIEEPDSYSADSGDGTGTADQ